MTAFGPPPFDGLALLLEALQRSSTQARMARLAKRIGVDELMIEIETKLRDRLVSEFAGRALDDSLRRDLVRVIDEVLDEVGRAGADA